MSSNDRNLFLSSTIIFVFFFSVGLSLRTVVWAITKNSDLESINVFLALLCVVLMFVELICYLMCLIAFLLCWRVILKRRFLHIPRSEYKDYKDHLKNGDRLLSVGKEEDFDPNTPVPQNIKSVKFAKLVWLRDRNRIMFQPVIMAKEGLFDTSPVAVCGKGKSHRSPEEDCSCGIYSSNSFDELLSSLDHLVSEFPSRVLLKCNLYGKILEASNGYKSERLQILSAEICKYCTVCSRRRYKRAYYATCLGANYKSKPVGRNILVPLCDKHSKKYERTWTIQQLREELKIDVDWYEITPL